MDVQRIGAGIALFLYVKILNAAVTALPNAQFAPTIDISANGVPVVDIVNPNQGISHNEFQEFNLDQKGVVLNNSITASHTYIAGDIAANHQLSMPAEHIVSVVKNNNSSILQGPIEVAGVPAQVWVINEHGIMCDGCGALNTQGFTLSTGNVQEFTQATQGKITITENGLSSDHFLQLNAQEITIHGMVNTPQHLNIQSETVYQAQHTTVSAKGPFTVNANTIFQNGTWQTADALNIHAHQFNQQGVLKSHRTIHVSGEKLRNTGVIQSYGDLSLDLNELENVAGWLWSGANITGHVQHLNNKRQPTRVQQEEADLQHYFIFTKEVETSDAAMIMAEHDIHLNVEDGINEASSIVAGRTLDLTGQMWQNTAHTLHTHVYETWLNWRHKLFGSKRRLHNEYDEYQLTPALLYGSSGMNLNFSQIENTGIIKSKNIEIQTEQFKNGVFEDKAHDLSIPPVSYVDATSGVAKVLQYESPLIRELQTQQYELPTAEVLAQALSLHANTSIHNYGFIKATEITMETPLLLTGKRLADVVERQDSMKSWTNITGKKAEPGGFIVADEHLNLNGVQQIENHSGFFGEAHQNVTNTIATAFGTRYVDIPTVDALIYDTHRYHAPLAERGAMIAIALAVSYASAIISNDLIFNQMALYANQIEGATTSKIMASGAIAGSMQNATMNVLLDKPISFHDLSWGAIQNATHFGTMNMTQPFTDGVQRVMVNVGTQSGLSYLSGNGDWHTQLKFGLATQFGNEVYVDFVGHVPDPRRGIVSLNHPFYTPFENGRVPRVMYEGEWRETLDIGHNYPDIITPSHIGLLDQGGMVSRTMNHIPGMNAVSVVHDVWVNQMADAGIQGWNFVLPNISTMPIAAVTTYAALLAQFSNPMN